MIHVFNRKELMITYSMKEQSDIREILAAQKIDYVVKTMNRTGNAAAGRGIRTATDRAFTDSDSMYEYKIYVHKDDYEKAKGVLKNDYRNE